MAEDKVPPGPLAKMILQARTKANISQSKFGDMLGYSRKEPSGQLLISGWERGSRPITPTDKQMVVVCDLLKVTLQDLKKRILEENLYRSRWQSRSRASKVSKANSKPQGAKAPKPTAPAKPTAPNPTPGSESRTLPKADLGEAILLALIAGEPDLSDKAGDVRALMRVVRRFNAITSAIATN